MIVDQGWENYCLTGEKTDQKGPLPLQSRRTELRHLLEADIRSLSYAQAYQLATQWNQMFHEELAGVLAPFLNQQLRDTPQQTLPQMREVATSVNADMKQLGIAIRCPATGQPSVLVAETKSGTEANVYRYRFQHTNGQGRPSRHSACRTLPELSLMPLPARIERFSKNYGRQDTGQQR
jgi:hypothetical protein